MKDNRAEKVFEEIIAEQSPNSAKDINLEIQVEPTSTRIVMVKILCVSLGWDAAESW